MFRGDDADPAQERQDDRQLEGDAEGEDQRHRQRQEFADFRQQLNLRGLRTAHLLHAEREPHQHRQHHEINQQRAQHEEERGCDQVRQERVAFVFVRARRHELVDLRRHDRERDEAGAEQRELQLA